MLGPNGAGKSTLVRAVATLLQPDGGRLVVAGIDAARHPDQVRRAIGLAGQHAAVEPAMTGRENLVMVARLFGHARRSGRGGGRARCWPSSARGVGRPPRAHATPVACAAGSTSAPASSARPGCCCSTSRRPGLDPRSRIELWDAIRSLVRGGTDVLLTTQYLEEADQLADRITIVDHGQADRHRHVRRS